MRSLAWGVENKVRKALSAAVNKESMESFQRGKVGETEISLRYKSLRRVAPMTEGAAGDFAELSRNVATLQRFSPFGPIVGEFLCETGPGLVQ